MAEHSSQTTTDHDEIKRWVEERNGRPARVKDTGDGDDPGVLRINFPGGAEDSLDDISWDDWFEAFERNDLAFLYQEQKKSGEGSTFFKLIARDNDVPDAA